MKRVIGMVQQSRGQDASPWKLGGLTSKQVGQRSWEGINNDDVFGRSAQLAYYFFFAIFPLAIFLIAILGIVVGGSAAQQDLINYLTRVMPASAHDMLQQTVSHSVQASGGGKLTFGIVLALLSASGGMLALMGALNAIFEVREGRGMIRQRATALGLTLATGILVLLAIGLITFGGNLAHSVAGGSLYWIWQIVQYPIAIAFLLFSYSLIYYFAPNVDHPKWHWVTPGAVVGVILWLIVSFGLRVYLHFFNTYSATYGALGAVMVLLLWFYVTGMAILIGGEINAVVERAAMNHGSREQQLGGGEKQVNRERPAA